MINPHNLPGEGEPVGWTLYRDACDARAANHGEY